MSSQGRGFTGYAFHHVAVAAHGIHVVVEHLEAGTIKVGFHPLAGHRHADAVSHPLAERSSRGFHARGQSILGMPRSLAVDLAKVLDVFEGDGIFPEPFIPRIYLANTGKQQERVQRSEEHTSDTPSPDKRGCK